MSTLVIGQQAEGTAASTGGAQIIAEKPEAFRYPALRNADPLEVVEFHLGASAQTATSLSVAIMSSVGAGNGEPGAVLAEVLFAPGGGTFSPSTTYEVTGFNLNLAQATPYWIVLTPIGGTLHIRLHKAEEAGSSPSRLLSTPTKVTKAGQVTAWGAEESHGPIFLAGLGVEGVSTAGVSGGGTSTVSSESVRSDTAIVSGGGSIMAVNPASKGVSQAIVDGGGSPSATSASRRQTADAQVSGGGAAGISPIIYGLPQIYSYAGLMGKNIWRVVAPVKATTPGSPIIVWSHVSSSDEPNEAEQEEVLPKVGEPSSQAAWEAAHPGASKAEKEAWKHGNGAAHLSLLPLAERAAEQGFACFVPTYRPVADGYPSMYEDIEQLLRWVKEHAAEWNGDPTKVFIVGGSLGASYGFYEGLKLNSEHGAGYIRGVAGLSGPVDWPSRIKGRNEELATREAWEVAHPGFTKAELEAWEAEHNFATTDVVIKLAHILNVPAGKLGELGWLEGPSAEQKAALALADQLSPTFQLATESATMPYLWYAVSKEDLTPQQQGVEMSEAAAAHGQPGKYHFDATVPNGHAFAYWGEVEEEVLAYFRQALDPAVVPLASVSGGGSGDASTSTLREVPSASVTGGGSAGASVGAGHSTVTNPKMTGLNAPELLRAPSRGRS